MNPAPRLHTPARQRYSCKRCGDGCHIFNEYPLDDASRARMEGLLVEDLLPSELAQGGWYEPAVLDPSKTVLKRRAGDRACVFRDADMLCGVHKKHGLEAKPRVCQDFPYRFVATPTGVYPGLSFACTAVLENHGEELTAQEPDLRALYEVSGAVTRREDPVMLTDLHQISWEAWQVTLGALDTIIQTPGRDVGECLAAASVYTDLFRNLIVELRQSLPAPAGGTREAPVPWPPDCGKQGDAAAARAIARQFTEGEGLERLFAMARRPRPVPTVQSTLIGLMASFRTGLDAGDARPGRLTAVRRIVTAWFFNATGMGRLRLPGLPDSFSRRELAGIPTSTRQEPIEDLLRRYFSHAVFRQDLLLARNVWTGQRWQLLHFAMIRVYTAAEAIMRGEREASVASFRAAIRNVEKYFVYHGGFQRLFDHYPAMGQLFDASAAKPHYAASMIIPPFGNP